MKSEEVWGIRDTMQRPGPEEWQIEREAQDLERSPEMALVCDMRCRTVPVGPASADGRLEEMHRDIDISNPTLERQTFENKLLFHTVTILRCP